MAHGRAVRSAWASGRGKIMPRCVLGGLAVARFRRGAFPGGNPWQFFRLMHLRGGFGRENRQFAARFARHASENGLALARYARHASEMPRKSPLEDTPREDLARKGHFSLHGPLESCTARESCHPASTKRPSARNPCAADQRQTARAPATPAPPNSAEQREPPTTTPPPSWAAHHPQHSRCQRQPHRKRSHTPPPRDTEASGGREILRRPSPAAPKRSSGTNGTAAPHGAIWPQHPQRRWRHQTRCEP